MNLNQILKSIDSLNEEQKRIERKFSTKTDATFTYKDELKHDEIDDLRIFGYTQAHLMNKMRKKYRSLTSFIPKSTKIFEFEPTDQPTSQRNEQEEENIIKSMGINTLHYNKSKTRPQTHILHSYSKKEENTKRFLKKDLFLKYESIKSEPFKNGNKGCSLNKRETRKKSIMNFKQEFKSDFQDNLIKSKFLAEKTKQKYKLKVLTNEPENNPLLKIPKQNCSFFSLTQNEESKNKQFEILKFENLKSLEILKKLNIVIFDNFSTSLCSYQKGDARGYGELNWKCFEKMKEIQSSKFYLISIPDLEVTEIPLMSLPKINIQVEKILKSSKIVHFCIIQSGKTEMTLVFEEFFFSKNITLQSVEYSTDILRYYFQRFLLFGGEYSSIESLLKKEEEFFKAKFQKDLIILCNNENKSHMFLLDIVSTEDQETWDYSWSKVANNIIKNQLHGIATKKK